MLFRSETATKQGIYFTPGENSRISGWMQIKNRLAFNDEGEARLYFFNTCRHAIRTIPALVHSETFVEDLDTSGEDHIADELRYCCCAHWTKAIVRNSAKRELADDPLDMLKRPRYY